MAGNGAQDCGARHAGGTVNPDSNDERPAGCRSPVGERGRNTDFSDALRKRGIEEIEQEASDEERPDSRRRKK